MTILIGIVTVLMGALVVGLWMRANQEVRNQKRLERWAEHQPPQRTTDYDSTSFSYGRDRKTEDDCDFIVYYALGGRHVDPRKR